MARPAVSKSLGVFIAMLFFCGTAMAQQSKSIAAVVNEEVISIFDLNERLSLVMASSQSRTDPEIRKRLAPMVSMSAQVVVIWLIVVARAI